MRATIRLTLGLFLLTTWSPLSFAKDKFPREGMVSADHPQAAQVGAAILAQGGDAVDAAVATALALGVTHPFASGIGGGGFALVRRASGESLSLDFREVAPASAHKDMFVGPNGSVIAGASTLGARAVGVPGELAGLNHLHKRFGKLPWRSVVQPAIRLARDGFSITPLMHSKIQEHYSHLKDTVLGPHLVDASGQIRPVGSIVRYRHSQRLWNGLQSTVQMSFIEVNWLKNS